MYPSLSLSLLYTQARAFTRAPITLTRSPPPPRPIYQLLLSISAFPVRTITSTIFRYTFLKSRSVYRPLSLIKHEKYSSRIVGLKYRWFYKMKGSKYIIPFPNKKGKVKSMRQMRIFQRRLGVTFYYNYYFNVYSLFCYQ